MLSARSARMVARGEPALDIDAEVAKLLAPAQGRGGSGHDAELEAEVRELVTAKNERRVRTRFGAPGRRRRGAAHARRALVSTECGARSDINAEWPTHVDTSSTS